MTKHSGQLPRPAAELERLAEYYDTHDTSTEMDNGDWVEPQPMATTSLRLPADVIDQLKQQARTIGSVSRWCRTWAHWPGWVRKPAWSPGNLLAGVSASARSDEERALLADLLDWHRREDKPAWWRYFYVRTLPGLGRARAARSLG